jgi:hypothetical protein
MKRVYGQNAFALFQGTPSPPPRPTAKTNKTNLGNIKVYNPDQKLKQVAVASQQLLDKPVEEDAKRCPPPSSSHRAKTNPRMLVFLRHG